MTWDELSNLLSTLGEDFDVKVRRVGPPLGPETVAMHIVPVAWFVAMRLTGALNIGRYEGDEHRLVGTEQIPLAELTPEFVRERVEAACGERVRQMLDPEIVREVMQTIGEQRLRDADPGRFQDMDQEGQA